MRRKRERKPAAADLTEEQFEELKRATGHACPPWCHKCPLMDGMIYPACDGTAIMGRSPHDMSYCTCNRSKVREVDLLRRRVERLEQEVAKLRAEGGNARG